MRAAKAAGMIAMLAAVGPFGAGASEMTAAPIEARALIALTRETRATYTVVGSTLIYLPDGTQVREWAAEFHDGIHHRVETPRDRAIADCDAMTGVHLNVTTVEVTEEPGVALAACGVQAHSKILSARLGGTRQTRFGPAMHLVIVDETDIRTYDVAPDGALLNATITGRDGTRKLVMRAVHYAADVPAGIFTASSLGRSAVPANLRGSGTP
jgi:hypothetical protein